MKIMLWAATGLLCSTLSDPRESANALEPDLDQNTSTITVIALGDSLTDGYGLDKDLAYPKLLEEKLHKEGLTQVKIINAGISGSTTAGAAKRLNWHLKSKPQILILALGANDGLRGVPIATTRQNLINTIRRAKKEKLKVLLAGMMLPPNYGEKYTNEFKSIFKEIAKSENVELIPFLLEGVAGKRNLNLEDGIHPNEKGHKMISKTVYKYLKPLISRLVDKKPKK